MQIASKLGIRVQQVKNVIIWGNHSSTQYPDVNHGTVELADGLTPIRQAVKDDDWLNGDFVKVCHCSVICSIVVKVVFIVLNCYVFICYYFFTYSGVHLGVKRNLHLLWFCTTIDPIHKWLPI